MFCRRSVLAVLVVAAVLGGCASPDTSESLPAGPELVTASAKALTSLHSVRFTAGLSGTVPGLPFRQIEGDATVDGGPPGAAKGRADMQESLDRFQLDYLLQGDTLHVTGKDGQRQDLPAQPEFTPVALLRPPGGLYRLLTNATDLKTETTEKLDTVETYRVAAKLSKAVISSVVPGIQADVDIKFWIEQAASRQLMRMWLQIPPSQPNEGAVMLELALSNQNVPVILR